MIWLKDTLAGLLALFGVPGVVIGLYLIEKGL